MIVHTVKVEVSVWNNFKLNWFVLPANAVRKKYLLASTCLNKNDTYILNEFRIGNLIWEKFHCI